MISRDKDQAIKQIIENLTIIHLLFDKELVRDQFEYIYQLGRFDAYK